MRARLWAVGLAAAVVGAALTISAAGRWEIVDQAAPPATGTWQESGDWTADTRNGWRDDDRTPRLQLNLRTAGGSDRWGFGVRVTDLQGLPDAALDGSAADVRFTLAREAGTFAFTGSFTDQRGAGRYTFTPNAGLRHGDGRPRLPVADPPGRREAGRARREHGVREGLAQRRPDVARRSTS